MADVRLTATNPDDSTVVPVACNAKGELKLEEPPTFDGNVDGDLTVSGSATLAGEVVVAPSTNYGLYVGEKDAFDPRPNADNKNGLRLLAGSVTVSRSTDGPVFLGRNPNKVGAETNDFTSTIYADGSAEFAGGSATISENGWVQTNDTFTSNRTTGSALVFSGKLNGSQTSSINAHGSAALAKEMTIGTDANPKDDGGWAYTMRSRRHDNALIAIYNEEHTTPSAPYVLRCYRGFENKNTVDIRSDGKAIFSDDVVVGSRGQKWMIVESGGLAHLVAQTREAEISTADLVADPGYPPLRDIPAELTMVEQQLQKVLEKLRMIPEAGWEVWDGSD